MGRPVARDAGAPIPGIKFMTGTDVALDHYMQPSRRAAEAAIGGHTGDAPKKAVGSSPEKIKKHRCEGEDLNLHGSYPASTSIQSRITEQASVPEAVARRLPGAEPDTLLANEAQALLDAAASQQQVETARLREFARACLELSETGRLALAVLDGGLFASRRALELAAHVLRYAEQHAAGDSDADAIKKTVA
jgi:hypothetical protein